jgi:hypothetical protein
MSLPILRGKRDRSPDKKPVEKIEEDHDLGEIEEESFCETIIEPENSFPSNLARFQKQQLFGIPRWLKGALKDPFSLKQSWMLAYHLKKEENRALLQITAPQPF